jgi:hypothetical protein
MSRYPLVKATTNSFHVSEFERKINVYITQTYFSLFMGLEMRVIGFCVYTGSHVIESMCVFWYRE